MVKGKACRQKLPALRSGVGGGGGPLDAVCHHMHHTTDFLAASVHPSLLKRDVGLPENPLIIITPACARFLVLPRYLRVPGCLDSG